MSLSEKSVLVTGGARNIGKAICKELLLKGCKVAILDLLEDEGNASAKELSALPNNPEVTFIKCDITNESEFESAFLHVKDLFGSADILVNCAGLGDERYWEKMVSVNFTAMVRGCMLAFKHLKNKAGLKGGTVLNIASVICYGIVDDEALGNKLQAAVPVYTATKHGVISFTRVWSDSLNYADTNVKMMALCPDLVDTELSRAGVTHSYDQGINESFIDEHPAPTKPEQVAKEAVRLLEEDKNGVIATVSGTVGNKYIEYPPFPGN